ncbi:MAG: hypothetical protein CMO74_00600 [Verrucomicrobiales bacterium]|nr:hypothetical protein [Verrucomicrobiales bacterium]|tara:strand:- start:993 stop:1343 length:351 start_codon:yes stop_codon:yes gene_type:complete
MSKIKWLTAGLRALALCGPTMADDKKKPAEGKKKVVNILKELKLSKEQRKKLNESTKEIREQAAKLRTNKDLDKKEKAKQLRELKTANAAAIKKVLNGGQLKQYEDYLAKVPERKK